MVFPSTSVGGTNKVLFTVRNEGNAATQVTSISAAGTGTTFTLSGLPALPTQLGAGQSVSFTATFSPVTSGNNSGTLKIDTQSFTLSGFASPPPALSPYTFSGAGGAIDSQQQPLVGLSLSSAYPLALTGTLTLGFVIRRCSLPVGAAPLRSPLPPAPSRPYSPMEPPKCVCKREP
ncbi:MAG: choice-of-anchor D domain-containing protein [Acidobacteria bacterium]|nr:choice-of-anchor D domain-containing protein [Acidobacteriota bacterium]